MKTTIGLLLTFEENKRKPPFFQLNSRQRRQLMIEGRDETGDIDSRSSESGWNHGMCRRISAPLKITSKIKFLEGV